MMVVCVVVAQAQGSRQADSLLARRHGGTDSTHGTCQQRVGKDRPSHQNLPTMSCVADMLGTFPTKQFGSTFHCTRYHTVCDAE